VRQDQLYNVSFKEVQQAAMAVLTNLQTFRPQAIVAGAAWIFLTICERYDVSPRAALETAERVRRHAMDVAPQYPRAIAQYAREELPRG